MRNDLIKHQLGEYTLVKKKNEEGGAFEGWILIVSKSGDVHCYYSSGFNLSFSVTHL